MTHQNKEGLEAPMTSTNTTQVDGERYEDLVEIAAKYRVVCEGRDSWRRIAEAAEARATAAQAKLREIAETSTTDSDDMPMSYAGALYRSPASDFLAALPPTPTVREIDEDAVTLVEKAKEGLEASAVAFLLEMATYFERRPTNGEDMAFWANVTNKRNCEGIASLVSSLREENERLRKERDHWQANHDQMVQRNAVLRERPDLPVDRLPAIARYEEQIAALMNERASLIATKREQLEKLTASRDAALQAEDEAKDCFWAIYPEFLKMGGGSISTVAARTRLSDALSASQAREKIYREALERVADIMRRNFGRQNEKLADIEQIARLALSQNQEQSK